MKVCVAAWGTRGDCTPMIMIARELIRQGHPVRLLINDRGDNFASKSEFPDKIDLAGTYEEEIPVDQQVDLMSSDNAADLFAIFTSIMERHFPTHMEQILEAAEGMDVLLYTQCIKMVTISASEKTRTPCVLVALQPQVPNSYEPSCFFFATPFMFQWVNNLTWKVLGSEEYKLTKKCINPLREGLGLAPVESHKGGMMYLTARHPLPMVCAYSSELAPIPPDAPIRCPGAVLGDYPFSAASNTKLEEEFVPMEDLLQFLNASESKPVYIGWGSMSAGDRTFASELAFRALRASGQRAVVFRGNAGVSVSTLDTTKPDYEEVCAYARDNSIEVDYVPHSWLFPRCAAAVHHGGSGTTHAALRAGIPNIITPFGIDQPYWQYRCYAMGIGPRAPKFWHIKWEELGRVIASTVGDKIMCARAAEAGERARARPEDGVQASVRIVEATVGETEMWTRYFDNGGFTGPDCWDELKGELESRNESSCMRWW